MSLTEELNRIRAGLEARIPAEALAIMHAATDALIASGQAERIAKPGSELPPFSLPDPAGTAVASEPLLMQRPLVITVFRSAWCPYCMADLQAMADITPTLEEHGVGMVAITPQAPAGSAKQLARQPLPMPLLHDRGNSYLDLLGLRFVMPDSLISLYRDQFSLDLTAHNDDPSWSLPMPGRFLVDRDGIIRYAEASADYTKRPEPTALLDAVAALTAT